MADLMNGKGPFQDIYSVAKDYKKKKRIMNGEVGAYIYSLLLSST